MTYAVELDVAREWDMDEAAFLAEVHDNLVKDRPVSVSILEWVGPAGGNPLVRFTSDDHAALSSLVDDYTGGEDPADFLCVIEKV